MSDHTNPMDDSSVRDDSIHDGQGTYDVDGSVARSVGGGVLAHRVPPVSVLRMRVRS